jgi:diguanylate cyclase (GGDEF)-like protein
MVNDRMGHAAGDELLKHVARRLQVEIRSEDTVARLGGDEFVLIVGDLASQAEVEPILKRILHYLAESYQLRGKTLAGITCSIGVTIYPDDDANPDTLLRHADHAMYQAKRAGKANYSWFNSESEQRQTARKRAEIELSQALSKKQLVLHYQPIINAQAGRVVSAEALIRWQHPILGCLPPAHFLPLIQDRELSIAIGSFVIEQALKDSCRWRNGGLDIDVHVNLDVCQLQQEDFLLYIRGLLQAHGCGGAKLTLELVEDAALEGVADLSSLVSACEAIGVKFAIDDFGTGYSSLNHLRQISAGVMKIDRSFVSGMLTDAENRTLIEAIIGLGKAFERTIIAEGVEQFTQATALLDAGCQLMQGFYFAKPMPAHAVPAWTQRFESSSKSQITNESGYRNDITTRAGV